jgi:hypothetical protein
MTNIKLQRSAEGPYKWETIGPGGTQLNTELDWAALAATQMAAKAGVAVDLGEGVPPDALHKGHRLGEILESYGWRSKA